MRRVQREREKKIHQCWVECGWAIPTMESNACLHCSFILPHPHSAPSSPRLQDCSCWALVSALHAHWRRSTAANRFSERHYHYTPTSKAAWSRRGKNSTSYPSPSAAARRLAKTLTSLYVALPPSQLFFWNTDHRYRSGQSTKRKKRTRCCLLSVCQCLALCRHRCSWTTSTEMEARTRLWKQRRSSIHAVIQRGPTGTLTWTTPVRR